MHFMLRRNERTRPEAVPEPRLSFILQPTLSFASRPACMRAA
jgi:hypothetical protein